LKPFTDVLSTGPFCAANVERKIYLDVYTTVQIVQDCPLTAGDLGYPFPETPKSG
jgi:hypothetical protein